MVDVLVEVSKLFEMLCKRRAGMQSGKVVLKKHVTYNVNKSGVKHPAKPHMART